MRILQTNVSLLCAFLMLFVTACAPSKPTDTAVTTTLDDSNNITTHSSLSVETTVSQMQETTRSDKTKSPTTALQSTTSTPTISITYPQKQKRFTSLDEYCRFVETVKKEQIRSIFEKKESDGSTRFYEKTFEIILQDRQYLLPTVPNGYTFKSITMFTLEPLLVVFKQSDKEYGIYCFMSKEEKMPYTEENECFIKSDGTKVTIDYFPRENSGGTCYWENSGYQCFAWFTNENKEEMWNLIKEFELKIMPIE